MTILKNELEMLIPKENIKYNEQMSKHTSFKTGGIADYYITAKNENEVKKVLEFANKNDIPLHIIGNGSNILVQDDGIRGIVLKIEDYKYFVPLYSYKEHYKKYKDNPSFFFVYDRKNKPTW